MTSHRQSLDHPLLWVAVIVALLYATVTPFAAIAGHPVTMIVSTAILGFLVYTLWFMRAHSWRRAWSAQRG